MLDCGASTANSTIFYNNLKTVVATIPVEKIGLGICRNCNELPALDDMTQRFAAITSAGIQVPPRPVSRANAGGHWLMRGVGCDRKSISGRRRCPRSGGP